MFRTTGCILILILSFASASAEDSTAKTSDAQKSICLVLESAARANDLPVEFFARLIWQESRFHPNSVGPITRSGKRALGIAQFMPGTAAERDLLDPFDPLQALPKSAEFLRELRREFGNLGLAAAAYNAGPRRVREWIAGTGPLPVGASAARARRALAARSTAGRSLLRARRFRGALRRAVCR